MKESLLKLAKLLADDEKFLKEFSSKKSVDEQYDFAQKKVSGYTKEEFENFLDELKKSYELKSALSPEEMEKVSGGAIAKTKVAAMAMVALDILGAVPILANIPMKTSAMVEKSTVAEETDLNFDELFATEKGQDLFDYSNSSEGGGLRNLIIERLSKDPDCCSKIQGYYVGSNKYLKWIRSVGWTWTGWKFESNKDEVINDVKNNSFAQLSLWLLEKFEEGYWLYYNKDSELTLCKSRDLVATQIGYDWFKKDMDTLIQKLQIRESSAPKAEGAEKSANETGKSKSIEVIDEETFKGLLKDLAHKLNQARAFRGACEKVGKKDLANVVMHTI